MAQARSIRMHRYVDDWLIQARDKATCFQDTQTLLALCQELGWVVNLEKSKLEPKPVFNLVGYQYNLFQGVVRPSPERWEALNYKISSILFRTTCSVRQPMSLIGLLRAMEKQVLSESLHMRPIQWHLKNHWHITESLEKIILIPHLTWWLKDKNVLPDKHLHPLRHTVQIFTDALNKGWGTYLGDSTTRDIWSISESKLHINFPEFEPLCQGQVVLVATDNTTVVAYINKKGAIRSGSLCSLLWRFLMQPQKDLPEGRSHSGPAQCDSRQAVQTSAGHSDGMVAAPGGLSSDLPQVAPSQERLVCHQVQQQIALVRVPNPRCECTGSGRSEPAL